MQTLLSQARHNSYLRMVSASWFFYDLMYACVLFFVCQSTKKAHDVGHNRTGEGDTLGTLLLSHKLLADACQAFVQSE